jgi:hypothetical protein
VTAAAVAATVTLLGILGGTSIASAQTFPQGTSGAATVTGPAAGSNVDCTGNYNWYVSGGTGLGGYAKVEWTSNPCTFLIQARVWCQPVSHTVPGSWSYSGIVKRTYLWDQAGCGALAVRGGSYVHFSYDGGSTWSSYKSI